MASGPNKLILAKDFLIGLSIKTKFLVAVGVLFLTAGGTIVVIASNSSPKVSTTTDSSATKKQSSIANNTVLAEANDNTVSQGSNMDTSNSSTSTQNNSTNSNSPGQTGSNTAQGQTLPVAPTPDYNLNENWYIAVMGGHGPLNTCWPDPFTAENEALCMGAEMDFTGVGIAKTAQSANDAAHNQLTQNAAAAHGEARRGGPILEATLLTESLCIQYSLSCGRW